MPFNWSKMIEEHGANKEAIKAIRSELQATSKALWSKVSSTASDVQGLRESRAYVRGGWAVIALVGTIAGTVGAILSRIFWH